MHTNTVYIKPCISPPLVVVKGWAGMLATVKIKTMLVTINAEKSLTLLTTPSAGKNNDIFFVNRGLFIQLIN